MRAEHIITKKRDGHELNENEIKFMVNGFVSGEVADYQMSALLMAIYFRGMNLDETYWLTKTMIESGRQVDLSQLEQFPIDKHSTGGVGDKVSLVLAPLMAAAGLAIPMMSGRGLGHSGGTLDKLEAIPGFKTTLKLEQFIWQLEKIGVAMIGQTEEIVPADRKMYALRDSTATVPSIPLVVASILSKKIAEGARALVLDIKSGKGAFFSDKKSALRLADSLITIGKKFGLKISALMTAMDQPLGYAVGNWLETREAIETLQNKGPADLVKIIIELGIEMLIQSGAAKERKVARKTLKQLLANGSAFEKFCTMVKMQGGNLSVIENPNLYPKSLHEVVFESKKAGFVSQIDAYKIGSLAMELGAGRKDMQDSIDYTAGIILNKKVTDRVQDREPIARMYFSKNFSLNYIIEKLERAIVVSEFPAPTPNKLILKRITSESN